MIFLLFSKIFRPDFDASREKLRRLGDAEGTLTKEEFNKMKQELEAEYLATFKVCNYLVIIIYEEKNVMKELKINIFMIYYRKLWPCTRHFYVD